MKAFEFGYAGRGIAPEELSEAHRILEEYRDVEFTPDTVQTLTAEDFTKKSPVVMKYFAQSLLELAEKKRNCSFRVSLLDFGPGAVLGVPCEPFAAAGLFMRKELLRGKTALTAILNNGSGTGYIPNPWNYDRGGYETTPRSSPFSVRAMEKLPECTKHLTQEEK